MCGVYETSTKLTLWGKQRLCLQSHHGTVEKKRNRFTLSLFCDRASGSINICSALQINLYLQASAYMHMYLLGILKYPHSIPSIHPYFFTAAKSCCWKSYLQSHQKYCYGSILPHRWTCLLFHGTKSRQRSCNKFQSVPLRPTN